MFFFINILFLWKVFIDGNYTKDLIRNSILSLLAMIPTCLVIICRPLMEKPRVLLTRFCVIILLLFVVVLRMVIGILLLSTFRELSGNDYTLKQKGVSHSIDRALHYIAV